MKRMRNLVFHTVLTAAVTTAGTAGAAAKTVADNINKVGSQPVSFLSGANKVAANLYLRKVLRAGKSIQRLS